MDESSEVRVAAALRDAWRAGYTRRTLRGDLLAGVTVGIVAVPLAMALAIASGVSPQYGLYTSIVAGVVIALSGGSRVNVSGPTAAFVVILLPITHQYGLGGLLVATVMAGLLLVGMGLARIGRFIQFIPYPVTLGFTAGIGTVIAVLQIKDFLGLVVVDGGTHFLDKIMAIGQALPTLHGADLLIGMVTFAALLLWPRLKTPVPGHLIGLLAGAIAAWLLGMGVDGFTVETIGSRFHYDVSGLVGQGVPPLVPSFVWPWELPNAQGEPLGLSFDLIRSLAGPAFAIAMLGAIESLLCAVVADGLTGYRHNPNAELIGQGLGNIIAPFFGGITATGAIARTATSIRAGGTTPVAAVVHALFVLVAVLSLAPLLAYIPMASLAALLMMVAWNMAEVRHVVHTVRTGPRSDVVVLLACFGLTVIFDMVLAVGVGVVLAALLFIRRMTELTGTLVLNRTEHSHLGDLPEHVAVYDINGPLFFGAAEKAFSVFRRYNQQVRVMIIDMADVPMIDMTGIVAFQSALTGLLKKDIAVVITNLSPVLIERLTSAGIREDSGKLRYCADIQCARRIALELRPSL